MHWKALTKNWLAKIICLVLAVGLWFYIANDGFQLQQVSGGVPIHTINLSERLAVIDKLGEVQVSVRPAQGLRKTIQAEEFDAYVDLAGLTKGSYELPVKISAGDTELQVLEVTPSRIRVTLDDRVEKIFSVTVVASGAPGEGYVTGESRVAPDRVVVAGAESLVGSVQTVVAEVKLNGELSEVRKAVELRALDDGGNTVENIYIEPKTAEISIPVSQETDVKTVGVKIKTTGQPKTSYFVKSLTADPSTVVLRGQRGDLAKIEYVETKEVDLKDLSANTERTVGLDLPEGIRIEGRDNVKVSIAVESAEITRAVNGTFEFRNLADNLRVDTYSPTKVSLTVSGKSNRVAALTEKDVRVIVDLAGKGEGTFTIELSNDNVTLPSEVSLESLDVKEIQVVIRSK